MASISGLRSLNRFSLPSLRSFVAKSKGTTPSPSSAAAGARTAAASSPSPTRRFPSFSRSPVELGCLTVTLFPLHSAVAAARLTSCLSSTSRSCRALSQGTPGLTSNVIRTSDNLVQEGRQLVE